MKTTRKPTDAALASKFNVTQRTIRNWRKQGAPLEDPDKLKTWLADRRQIPLEGAVAPGRKSRSKPPTADRIEGLRGAVARLQRAELQAADAARAAGQDPLAVRRANSHWLATCEQLRKSHLALDDAQREAGEFVARAEVERILTEAGSALRVAGAMLTEPFVGAVLREPTVATVSAAWKDAYDNRLAGALGRLCINSPGWVVEALCKAAELPKVEPMAEALRVLIEATDRGSADALRKALTTP
jgi:hypothetical protein